MDAAGTDKGSESLQVVVPEGTRTQRADKLLAQLHPDFSRSRWQKLLEAGHVWQDERRIGQSDRLHAGDVVDVSLPPLQPLELIPVAMDLDFLYEDEHLLVVNKPAGLVVHPGAGTGDDTLVHGLLHHCRGQLPGIGGEERPGIVHRLDKETSGAIVVARSEIAMTALAAQFADRTISKRYLAICKGVPNPASGSIHQPIARHPVHRLRMACLPGGRPSWTDYHRLRAWGQHAALLELDLHTGRTHQIRVHLQHLGHPILGDSLYGWRDREEQYPAVPRVMLHAARLVFSHPVTGREMTFEAPLPDDFRLLLAGLDQRFGSEESR